MSDLDTVLDQEEVVDQEVAAESVVLLMRFRAATSMTQKVCLMISWAAKCKTH